MSWNDYKFKKYSLIHAELTNKQRGVYAKEVEKYEKEKGKGHR